MSKGNSLPESVFIKSQNLTLHAKKSGKRGPLVLFLHGFGDFSFSWQPYMEALSEEFQVVSLDLRGFNLSDQPIEQSAYAMPELIQDIDATLQHFQAESVSLIGHDWGAYIAWHYALARPQKVSSVTSLNVPHPLGFFRELQEDIEQKKKVSYIRYYRSAGVENSMIPERLVPIPVGPNYQTYLSAMRKSSIKAMLSYYRANEVLSVPKAFFDDQGKVIKIQSPTKILFGEFEDVFVLNTLRGTEQWTEVAPEIEIIPGGRHNMHIENSKLIIPRIQQWLRKIHFPAQVGTIFPMQNPQTGDATDKKQIGVAVTEISRQVPRGYSVRFQDMNADGRKDILVSGKGLFWVEAPDWIMHEIISDQGPIQDIIAALPLFANNDRLPDLLVSSQFRAEQTTTGKLSLLVNPGRQEATWHVASEMDLANIHRLFLIHGETGQSVLASGLLKPGAKVPNPGEYSDIHAMLAPENRHNFDFHLRGAEMHFFSVPRNSTDIKSWSHRIVDETYPITHGLDVWPDHTNHVNRVYVASNKGIDELTLSKECCHISSHRKIGTGVIGIPFSGSGEVKAISQAGLTTAIVASEPWHGQEIVIYEPQSSAGAKNNTQQSFSRKMLHKLPHGQGNHGLASFDLEEDGMEEFATCVFGQGGGVLMFRRDHSTWLTYNLAPGLLDCNGIAALREPGSDRVILAAVGDKTSNLVVFEIFKP